MRKDRLYASPATPLPLPSNALPTKSLSVSLAVRTYRPSVNGDERPRVASYRPVEALGANVIPCNRKETSTPLCCNDQFAAFVTEFPPLVARGSLNCTVKAEMGSLRGT